MFKVITSLIILLFSTKLYALPNNPLDECKKPLQLSLTTNWFPYVYQQHDQPTSGIDVELLRVILSRLGCTLEVVHFPERRSLFELRDGHFDIGLGASKTPEREELFHFSVAYRHERNRFAYRATDVEISHAQTLSELVAKQKIIGINLAGWYGDELEQAKREYNGFVFSDTANKRLKMLQLIRIDIVIDDDVVLCSEIHKANYHDVLVHPMLLSQASIHYIFNKQSISKPFLAKFNQALRDTVYDGDLSTLFDKYVTPGCLPENMI